jgi:putative pyruvate formate lyase activating enzyme
VDIYKPDMKYTDADQAAKYSAGASDYPEVAKKAILEMHRQVGELKSNRDGFAIRGLLIRHLVMPNGVAGTEKFVKWVAENLPKTTYVNIMAQYRPEYKALEYPEIGREITVQEFLEAMDWAKKYGLVNLDSKSVVLYKIYDRRRSE